VKGAGYPVVSCRAATGLQAYLGASLTGRRTPGMRAKNLLGMPWRVALALQEDGWILRNAIVWHKPNAMPESVRDRLNCRHELIFLLVKQAAYWFGLDPIRVPHATPRPAARHRPAVRPATSTRRPPARPPGARHPGGTRPPKYGTHTRQVIAARRYGNGRRHAAHPRGRNPGDVWSIPTRPYRGPHFAAFPIDIPLRAIAAGCPPGGMVLDPFCGTGTTGLAARQLGRRFTGIDLSPEFAALAAAGTRRPEKALLTAALTPSQTPRSGVRSQARRRTGPHASTRPTPRHRPPASPRDPAGRATPAHPGRRTGTAADPAQSPRPGHRARKRGVPMTNQAMDLAFWGRVSTEDNQDPQSSHGWQITRANTLVEPRGGRIVTEFFDIDKSRSIPPQRRPQAAALLAALAGPNRGFDAVVVGEPQRAFYGNQFGNTFPLFAHYGVPLWVPEVGGPIDPDNEAHDLIMSVFGGVSKGERNRIKIRVRTAMAAQAQLEGRYLGGRPPYGYQLRDAGPHPNPAKAADGKRLHALALDEPAAAVVGRIFAMFLAGHGIYAIAEHLTREGIPCPSAHDPARNRHRCGIAWNKYAVRTILANPRYTGRQVWNRQRKDEVLMDVNDVALGHTTKLRWNDADQWIFSDRVVHPVSSMTRPSARSRNS
jgi:DNA invertase Pin-like site-specific DNA recombinase